MPIAKFILSADYHLRSVQYGSTKRALDFFKAALAVVDIAAKEKATVLMGGDITHHNRLTSDVSKQLDDLDEYAKKHGVRILAIMGNHDLASPSWCERYNDNMDFGIVDITGRTVVDQGIIVSGLYPCAGQELNAEIAKLCASSKTKSDVVLWHGAIRDLAIYPSESYVTLDEVKEAVTNFKAFLMGDIHHRMYMEVPDTRGTGQTTLVGYPGATEVGKSDDPLECSVDLITFDSETKRMLPPSPQRIMLPSARPIIVWNANSMGQIDELIERVKAVQDQEPLVLCNYSPGLKGAREKLYHELDVTKAMLRAKPDPRATGENFNWQSIRDHARELRDMSVGVVDVLGQIVSPGTDEYDLGRDLLLNPQDTDAIIDRFLLS